LKLSEKKEAITFFAILTEDVPRFPFIGAKPLAEDYWHKS
jgi:hypothetical protein